MLCGKDDGGSNAPRGHARFEEIVDGLPRNSKHWASLKRSSRKRPRNWNRSFPGQGPSVCRVRHRTRFIWAIWKANWRKRLRSSNPSSREEAHSNSNCPLPCGVRRRTRWTLRPPSPSSAGAFAHRNALTPLQQWHVGQFVNVVPGRAKIIGIHAPPIGPFTEWSDSELMKGVKTYAPGADSRARKPNGEIIKLTSHPLFAIGLRDNPNSVTADYGSFVKGRDGFIQRVADRRRGVRLVLSGHIHRHGLLVLSRPTAQRKAWLLRAVTHAGVRGILPPAVARRPDLSRTAVHEHDQCRPARKRV